MGTVLKLAASNDDAEMPEALPTFEDFWKLYPRKVAIKNARLKWNAIDPVEYPKIMRAVSLYRRTEDWRREGGKFIPYPATFLYQERWLDSLEIESDLTMGQCGWNRNGNRGPGGQCQEKAVTEKNGVVYCKRHGEQV